MEKLPIELSLVKNFDDANNVPQVTTP